MSSQIKYQFAVNLLTERLRREEKELGGWYRVIENKTKCWTDSAIKQAKGNIPSTESRIKELKEVLGLLNPSS